MTRYGLRGPVSRELVTLGGRVLVHTDRAELEWLFPGTTVVTIPARLPPEQTLPIKQHPDMAAVTWPLNRRDFR